MTIIKNKKKTDWWNKHIRGIVKDKKLAWRKKGCTPRWIYIYRKKEFKMASDKPKSITEP